MNQAKSISSPKPSWQQHMKAAIRSQPELLRRLGLPIDDFSEHEKSAFPLFAPLPYVGRIQPSDPCDPLLLQILIRPEEQQTTPGNPPIPELR